MYEDVLFEMVFLISSIIEMTTNKWLIPCTLISEMLFKSGSVDSSINAMGTS